MRSRIVNFLKYAVGIGLLAWVISINWHSDDPSSPGLSQLLRHPIGVGPLALAGLACAAAVFLTFVRWYILVRAQHLPFTLRNAVRLGLVGFYFNTFLPGAVGGDLLKAWFLSREQSRRTVAVATVMADRVIGLWGLIWLVGLLGLYLRATDNPALTHNEYLGWIVRVSLWIVGGSLAAWLAMGLLPKRRARQFAGWLDGLPRIGGPASELWKAIWLYRRGANWAVFAALGLSLVSHAGFVMTYHLASRVFTVPDLEFGTLAEHFLVVPVAVLALALFPTPGGVGGGEAAFAWLYADVLGKSAAAGVACMLTYRAIAWLLGFAGYLVYLWMRTAHTIPGDVPDPEPIPEPGEEEPTEPDRACPLGVTSGRGSDT